MPEHPVGILGTGHIAGEFDLLKDEGEEGVYSHAGAYREQGGFCLEVAADPDSARLQRFSQAWRPRRTTTDVAELLREPLEVLSICSPDRFHVDQAMQALEAGQARALWVEKPFSPDAREWARLRRLAAHHKTLVLVNFQRRFDPVLQKLASRLAGADIRLVRGLYHKGWKHIGTTLVDLIHMLLGPPRQVEARVRSPLEQDDPILDAVLHWDRFDGQVLSLDTSSAASPCHVFELEIFTSRERILLVDNTRRMTVHPVGNYVYGGVKVYLPESRSEATGYDRSMVHAAAFIRDFLEGKRAWSERAIQDCMETNGTINACLEAARLGVPVVPLAIPAIQDCP